MKSGHTSARALPAPSRSFDLEGPRWRTVPASSGPPRAVSGARRRTASGARAPAPRSRLTVLPRGAPPGSPPSPGRRLAAASRAPRPRFCVLPLPSHAPRPRAPPSLRVAPVSGPCAPVCLLCASEASAACAADVPRRFMQRVGQSFGPWRLSRGFLPTPTRIPSHGCLRASSGSVLPCTSNLRDAMPGWRRCAAGKNGVSQRSARGRARARLTLCADRCLRCLRTSSAGIARLFWQPDDSRAPTSIIRDFGGFVWCLRD